MPDIISLLVCLDQSVNRTTIKQLSRIIVAMLTMTGRVTMVGISRWSEKGGSYRTVQRFFGKMLPWALMSWLFVRHHLLCAEHEYVLAGDETIVTKAGKQSFGLDRFFSSVAEFEAAWPQLRTNLLAELSFKAQEKARAATAQWTRSNF